MDPNDLIDTIVDAIDYAEIARDTQGLNKARRLLNNDLRQAIDVYIQDEVTKALEKLLADSTTLPQYTNS
jgi:HD superfamily phosphohydrolase YqeK